MPCSCPDRDDGSRRYVCATGPGCDGCGRTYVLAEPLEEFVTEAVLWRLDTPELARAIRGQREDDPGGWQQQADEITTRLDELATAYANSEISMREWMTARDPLQQRQDAAQRQIRRDTASSALGAYVGSGGLLRQQWPELGIGRRHAILSAVLARVTVGARPSRVEPFRRVAV